MTCKLQTTSYKITIKDTYHMNYKRRRHVSHDNKNAAGDDDDEGDDDAAYDT